jgi:hypothetical protein
LRRLFSELFGTFLLVMAAAGDGILVGEGQIALGAAVVAPGLTVLAIILFIGRSPAPTSTDQCASSAFSTTKTRPKTRLTAIA